MPAHHFALALALTGPSVAASAQAVRVRVVATSSSGSVWRVSSTTVERAGPVATAWFFVDHRRDSSAKAASSRIRYRFHCERRRATRLERVALGPNGRVMARQGVDAEGPAGRGTFTGQLLDAACG